MNRVNKAVFASQNLSICDEIRNVFNCRSNKRQQMQSDAPVQRGREKIHVRNPASYLDLCINNVVGYDSEGDLLVRSGGETLVLSQDLLMFRKIDLSKQLAMGKEGRLLLWTRHTTLGVVCALF